MPLYDVRCNDCGHEWEVRKGFSDPLPSCPECGAERAKVFWKSLKVLDKAKDPYDLISSGNYEPTRKVKSFANDRRKGGKDTT
jgi:putative FmdB family regulatory protein